MKDIALQTNRLLKEIKILKTGGDHSTSSHIQRGQITKKLEAFLLSVTGNQTYHLLLTERYKSSVEHNTRSQIQGDQIIEKKTRHTPHKCQNEMDLLSTTTCENGKKKAKIPIHAGTYRKVRQQKKRDTLLIGVTQQQAYRTVPIVGMF